MLDKCQVSFKEGRLAESNMTREARNVGISIEVFIRYAHIYFVLMLLLLSKTGKCLSMLPSPPTTSPTSSDRTAPFWYPDYESPWSHATCLNTLPLPYKYINDRPNYSSAKECCKMAYAGQMSKACVCSLDSPPTRCPNVVKFEVTTITSVVTSTLNLGSITVPSDASEREELKEDLESTIFDMLVTTLGNDLQEIIILSIGGVQVRRGLRSLLSRSLLSTAVEFNAVVNTECTTDCETTASGNSVGSAIVNSVRNTIVEEMSDTAAVQTALQNSGNSVLASSTVENVVVNQNVETSSTSSTRVGVSCVSYLSYANYIHIAAYI